MTFTSNDYSIIDSPCLWTESYSNNYYIVCIWPSEFAVLTTRHTDTTWLHSVKVSVTQKLWVKWLKTAYCDPPVTVLTTCLTRLGGFISSRRMLGSVARGNPLSNISSSNYKNKPMIRNVSLRYKVLTINNEGVHSTGYFLSFALLAQKWLCNISSFSMLKLSHSKWFPNHSCICIVFSFIGQKNINTCNNHWSDLLVSTTVQHIQHNINKNLYHYYGKSTKCDHQWLFFIFCYYYFFHE